MTPTFGQIVDIMQQRVDEDEPLLRQMTTVRDRYNADWVLPNPAENDTDDYGDLTPAIIGEAVDFLALQASSVMPGISVPSLDPFKARGIRSQEYASLRRKELVSTWRHSRLNLMLRRAYRHLTGYATTCFVVTQDFENHRPRIQLRNPLGVYPEKRMPEDTCAPRNVGFVYGKSLEWLRWKFPALCQERGGMLPAPGRGVATMWDVVEWVDEDNIVIGILGARDYNDGWARSIQPWYHGNRSHAMELSRTPHWGRPGVVIPERVTLDRVASQVAHMVGKADVMAKLQALNMIAAEKAIFPDRYIIGDSTQTPRLIGGVWHDGRTGKVNVVENARAVGELRGTPDQTGQQMADRLERNVRVSTGLVPQAGGETYGALRTGRGMDTMQGIAVEPRVQELQEIMQVALEQVNVEVLECYRQAWPTRTYEHFTGWKGENATFTFEPAKHVETTENSVSYALPGADVQGTTIGLGQLQGMGVLSLETVRDRHPWVDDPEAEGRRVEVEKLELALAAAIEQQVASGEMPPDHVARIIKARRSLPSLVDAVEKVQKDLADEQAAENEAPPEGMAMDPNAMPGLAVPGAAPPPGAFGPPGAPPELGGAAGQIGPPEGAQGLRSLMEALSSAPPSPGPPAPMAV